MLPETRLSNADFAEYTVASGQSVRAGMPVKLNATNTGAGTDTYPSVQEAAADTDDAIGVCMGPVGTTYAADAKIRVAHVFSVVIPMMAGGTVTRGGRVTPGTNGVVNLTANGNGTTRTYSPGIALTGTTTSGDFITVGLIASTANKT